MPKVKLGESDPRESEIKAIVAAGKARQGLTNSQLAKKIGESQGTMEDHIRHFDRMHVIELWRIFDVLKVPMEERKNIL